LKRRFNRWKRDDICSRCSVLQNFFHLLQKVWRCLITTSQPRLQQIVVERRSSYSFSTSGGFSACGNKPVTIPSSFSSLFSVNFVSLLGAFPHITDATDGQGGGSSGLHSRRFSSIAEPCVFQQPPAFC